MIKRLFYVVSLLTLVGILPGTTHITAQAQQDGCGDPATLIHEVQGNGPTSPIGNQHVTLEGVVIGDYQEVELGLAGFFIQEEDTDADSDPQTSEGLFIFDNGYGVDVQPGDVVRLRGTVSEYSSEGAFLTQLRRLESLTVCSSGASVTPVALSLPIEIDWEPYEGMLVSLNQELTVSEVYNLGRYGEVMLVSGGRFMIPTVEAAPGEGANAMIAEHATRHIILDDGSLDQNPEPEIYPAPGLSAANTLRAGDTVNGATGVLDQRFGIYRLQPVGEITFTHANPRPAAPDPVGGSVTVASFNVLNYFNGDGAGGGFPTSRGASDADEFTRQRDKIIAAIVTMDADVIGLMEIENDGSGPESAVADMVNGINEIVGAGTYAYISDPAGYALPEDGGDEIKVALIYRPAVVTPVGDAVTTLDAPFGTRRPPLTQAFDDVATGERFTVVVNHFKSKSCTDAQGDDRDQDDGQGCYNAERILAAQTLTTWLATDPTGSGDFDVIIMGDLNAYTQEDPITAIKQAGYVDLLQEFVGESAYSYVYMGEAGYLDHALASASLAAQVSGVTVWHINADEPYVLDYNVEYKSPGQIASFYSPDPYRSSDHDPVLIGLNLGQQTKE